MLYPVFQCLWAGLGFLRKGYSLNSRDFELDLGYRKHKQNWRYVFIFQCLHVILRPVCAFLLDKPTPAVCFCLPRLPLKSVADHKACVNQYWIFVEAANITLESSLNVCLVMKWSEVKWNLDEQETGAAKQLDGHTNCELLLTYFNFLSKYSVSFIVYFASKYMNSDLIPFAEVPCFGRRQNSLRSGFQMLGCEVFSGIAREMVWCDLWSMLYSYAIPERMKPWAQCSVPRPCTG